MNTASMVAASILIVGLAATGLVVWRESSQVELFPLKDVLWVQDEAGTQHPLGSEKSTEMLAFLGRSGRDLSERKDATDVLINRPALHDSVSGDTPWISMGG